MKHRESLEDWEKELHRELMELPELEAPSTLILGVRSRIQTPAPAVWYHASWWHWPLALRQTSAALALSVLCALGWLGLSFGELDFGQALVQACVDLKGGLVLGLETCTTALGSAAVFWSENGQLILIAASALLLTTYLTCVAAGTALYRLAWRRSL
jgi:hypothetical protein